MRTDFLPALFLAASAVMSPADARMTSQMVRRSIDLQERAAADAGHLHLLTEPKSKRGHDSTHRRHHKKRACSAGSSNASSGSVSSSVSGNSTTSGNTKIKNNAKTSGTSSSSSAGDSSGSSSSSSKSNSGSSGSSDSSSSSSSSSSDSSSDTSSDSSTSSSGTTSASGSVSGFSGTNTGIGSWFRTDSSQDSTNGRSWCQLNYQDSWMGFAPDVSVMLQSGDTATAGKKYCGREAKATNPNNGKTALIYIVDGFDPKWVKTPGSIDLTLAAFEALYGSSPNGNKDTVIMNLQWEFTGNVKEEYTFNSGS